MSLYFNLFQLLNDNTCKSRHRSCVEHFLHENLLTSIYLYRSEHYTVKLNNYAFLQKIKYYGVNFKLILNLSLFFLCVSHRAYVFSCQCKSPNGLTHYIVMTHNKFIWVCAIVSVLF